MTSISEESLPSTHHENFLFAGVPGRRREQLIILHEADALFLHLDDSTIVQSEEVAPSDIFVYNEPNQALDFELHHLSNRSPIT